MRRHLITVAIMTGLCLSLAGSASAGWAEGVAAFQAGRWKEAIREIKSVFGRTMSRWRIARVLRRL